MVKRTNAESKKLSMQSFVDAMKAMITELRADPVKSINEWAAGTWMEGIADDITASICPLVSEWLYEGAENDVDAEKATKAFQSCTYHLTLCRLPAYADKAHF
jgi:hypothetical protein